MKKSTVINRLNKKLELQELIKTSDGVGGFLSEWKKIKDIWGSIEVISNTSNTTFNILEIKATHTIIVRKFNNINNNMRFIHKNSTYDIKYIDNLDNYFTEIICEKII